MPRILGPMKKKRMLALLSVNFARRLMPSVIGSFTYYGFALLTTDATMRRMAF